MKSIVRDVQKDDAFYKAIIFYEVGLPRVYDIPAKDDPRKFIRDVTKNISVSVSVLGWAIVDPHSARVIRSYGLNKTLYDEIESLLGFKLKREAADAYRPGKNEKEKGVPMGETEDVPVFQMRAYQR